MNEYSLMRHLDSHRLNGAMGKMLSVAGVYANTDEQAVESFIKNGSCKKEELNDVPHSNKEYTVMKVCPVSVRGD